MAYWQTIWAQADAYACSRIGCSGLLQTQAQASACANDSKESRVILFKKNKFDRE